MQARMKNIAMIVPDAMQALRALKASAEKGGVPARTLDLVELRASQIHGCSVCVDMHARHLKKEGETDERLFAVAAWRDTPWFTEAERAALALTEADGPYVEVKDSIQATCFSRPRTLTRRWSWPGAVPSWKATERSRSAP